MSGQRDPKLMSPSERISERNAILARLAQEDARVQAEKRAARARTRMHRQQIRDQMRPDERDLERDRWSGEIAYRHARGLLGESAENRYIERRLGLPLAWGYANGGITADYSAAHAGPAPVSAYMFARMGTQVPVYGLDEGGVAQDDGNDEDDDQFEDAREWPPTREQAPDSSAADAPTETVRDTQQPPDNAATEAQAEMAREDLAQDTEFVADNRINMDRTPIKNKNTLRNFQEGAEYTLLPLQLVKSAYLV
tara:strand:- start:1379 stop:2137 length:759 start_codon:yes stop_codon:yes gene_type:complete